jgi:hypothetical protein
MITLYDSGHYLIIVSVRYKVLHVILYWWYVNYKYNIYMQLLRTDIKVTTIELIGKWIGLILCFVL